MFKFFLLVFLITIRASGGSCEVNPNDRDLINGEPELIASTTNGQKLIIGDLDDP